MLKSVDPFTGETLETYKIHSEGYIDKELERMAGAKVPPLKERVQVLLRLSQLLKAHREDLALMATREMGKPLAQARAEVDKCALVCEFYAEKSPHWLRERAVEGVGRRAAVALKPLGLLFAIMPWNFPYWQVFRVLAPQIALGNKVVLKHASNVTGCGLMIEKLLLQASPEVPLFHFFRLDRKAAQQLMADRRIQAVTFTGSTEAGRSIAETAGRNLKKTVLELGGSDPYLILEDADLTKALKACVRGRVNNSGQSCIAAKRFLVVKERYRDFVDGMIQEFSQLRSGNPLKEEFHLGPLAKKSGLESLQDQLSRSSSQVKVVFEGKVPDQGFFFPPTVVEVTDPLAPVFTEETFGPLAAIFQVENEAQALQVARQSSYGLGGAVFTEDLERGWRLAKEELTSGSCVVNTVVQSYPELPFGGTHESGYGRELGEMGLWEFANVKSLVMG